MQRWCAPHTYARVWRSRVMWCRELCFCLGRDQVVSCVALHLYSIPTCWENGGGDVSYSRKQMMRRSATCTWHPPCTHASSPSTSPSAWTYPYPKRKPRLVNNLVRHSKILQHVSACTKVQGELAHYPEQPAPHALAIEGPSQIVATQLHRQCCRRNHPIE